jgi:hypothetical protein
VELSLKNMDSAEGYLLIHGARHTSNVITPKLQANRQEKFNDGVVYCLFALWAVNLPFSESSLQICSL